MDKSLYARRTASVLLVLLIPLAAHAAVDGHDILDNVHDVYATAAAAWAVVIKAHATRLFWTLALISMVWTFGMMALRSADVAEFFAEFIRFTLFTGFYWWLLDNGPAIAIAIIDSMRSIGASASAGTHAVGYPLPSPSSIVDIGFSIFAKVVENSSVWSPFNSLVGVLISLIILLALALMAVNILIVLISAWILAYAGIFFLGFGGSRWTSDMAISYFRTVLAVAAQLLVMVLLVGVGKTFIDSFYARMDAGLGLNEMAAVMVVAVVMLTLINKLPGLVSGLATGGGAGALGSGYSAGSALAAASMAGAAVSAVGAAIGGAAANVAGGAQALMAAVAQGSSADGDSGSSARNSMAGESGSGPKGGGSGPSSFAQAMGSDTSFSDSKASGIPSGQSTSKSGDSSQQQDAAKPAGSTSSPSSTTSNRSSSPGVKAARVAAGAASSLISGMAQMAEESMNDRISDTFGGRLASVIRDSNGDASPNTISAGKNDDFDPEAEVAAFRDRDKKDDEPEPPKA